MTVRSWLFVPGDSERKLAKAEDCGADVLILDLEDAVAPERKGAARALVREYLQAHAARRTSQLWVRVSPIDGSDCAADLAAVVAARPDGIVQPKPRAATDVGAMGVQLDALEREHGIAPGTIRILPIATETPAALFAIGGYAQHDARLAGLTWGAEDLSVAIGASGNQETDGAWTAPFQLARSLCLFGAAAAGVAAIDTLHIDYRDAAGLAASCAAARRDGFGGKLAIHPAQVGVINECFLPSEAELARARRIIALFAAHPGAAALSLDGRMVDLPHLRQAQQILARAAVDPGLVDA